MLVCLKSAESFYEPSALTRARSNNRCGFERPYSGRRSGAALRRGLRARPPPDPSTDIFKLGKTLTFVFCVDNRCSSNIEMTLLCQLQMTLPWDFQGGVWDDGSADKRS